MNKMIIFKFLKIMKLLIKNLNVVKMNNINHLIVMKAINILIKNNKQMIKLILQRL